MFRRQGGRKEGEKWKPQRERGKGEKSQKERERDVNLSFSKSHTARLVGVKTLPSPPYFTWTLKVSRLVRDKVKSSWSAKWFINVCDCKGFSSHRWGSGNRWSRIITSQFCALNYSSHPSLFRLMKYTVSSNSPRASASCNHHLMINKLCSD